MQPLNHDMDELMRNAAADYPVKPQGADWQKVAQQLDASEREGGAAGGYGYLKKLLLLLPFLLAGFVTDRFFKHEYGTLKKLEAVKESKHLPVRESNAVPVNSKSNSPKNSRVPLQMSAPLNQTSKGSIHTNSKNRFLKTKAVSKDMRTPGRSDFSRWHPVSGTESGTQQSGTITNITWPEPAEEKSHRIAVPESPQLSKEMKRRENDTREKVYASIVAGPDFSRVKQQRVEPAGYTVGLLVGYNITKRLAVEGGVFWDRKNYFSKGQYFKTDKLYLPQHSEVVQVDGYCAMFELPVNVRYKLLQKRQSTLAASVGASSYLMQHEDYHYVYRRYNVDYAGTTDYKQASKDWLSVANLGISYEHRVGAKTKIRIEPYARLPLKGVGIGSLPLRSVGFMAGITRTIQ